ncbi:serine hydrolase domain-containing protein [Caulobacter sp. KR2-114]|uniref:serine hydrolase domain-containing protein n=1 Tax=Caulobacter sp. KR2-114 TaxID=3400912 RepID=UPI003C01F7B4
MAKVDLTAAARFDLRPWIGDDDRPGAVAAVLSGGQVASWTARGVEGDGSNRLLTPDTVFYVASVSKQFTAACVGLCGADGLLDVDDPARRSIPELSPAFDPVTLRHLLHHLGGLPRGEAAVGEALGLPADWWHGGGLWEMISVLTKVTDLPQARGVGYAYSNAGYWLLAATVARASGQRFGDFARTRLFGPLGMAATRFRDDPTVEQPGLVTGHNAQPDGGITPNHTQFHFIGDGGLLTTLSDLARWDVFWTGRSALGPDLPAWLLRAARRTDGAWLYYRRGVSVRPHRGVPIISHGGSFVGYLSKLVRFPDQDFSVACLANADDVDVDSLSLALADTVLRDVADLTAPSWADSVRDDAVDLTRG